MNRRTVNRRKLAALCRRTLQSLELRPPLDVDLLRERLGERRGKPIDLVLTTNLTGRRTFGITASKPGAPSDVILVESQTTWAHQQLIVLHELAHMICDHPSAAIDHSYRANQVDEYQTISPAAVAAVLGTTPAAGGRRGKSLYDNPVEWEAETMATIMINWVPGCGTRALELPSDPLEAALSDIPTW